MTVGMTAGMTAGNVEKSSGAFMTDLTRDGKTLAAAGDLTLMTMASIATVAVITVRDSVGAIFRPIVNMLATIEVDGNRLNAYSEAVKQRTKKPLAEKSAAFYFVIYRARWQYLPMTTFSIILKRCDAEVSDCLMFQVDDGYAIKNYGKLSEEDRKDYLHRLQSLFSGGNPLDDVRRLLKG